MGMKKPIIFTTIPVYRGREWAIRYIDPDTLKEDRWDGTLAGFDRGFDDPAEAANEFRAIFGVRAYEEVTPLQFAHRLQVIQSDRAKLSQWNMLSGDVA
jgi:hypothetical protein